MIKLVNKTTFKEKLRSCQLLCSSKITLPFDNIKILSPSRVYGLRP